MERRRQGNGWETFFEHWVLALITLTGVGAAKVLTFFLNLQGKPWIYFLSASTVLLFTGAALIVYAKIPAYRGGRFFTFGVKSVPESLAGFYRWGWRMFLLAVVLILCLLLSKP